MERWREIIDVEAGTEQGGRVIIDLEPETGTEQRRREVIDLDALHQEYREADEHVILIVLPFRNRVMFCCVQSRV